MPEKRRLNAKIEKFFFHRRQAAPKGVRSSGAFCDKARRILRTYQAHSVAFLRGSVAFFRSVRRRQSPQTRIKRAFFEPCRILLSHFRPVAFQKKLPGEKRAATTGRPKNKSRTQANDFSSVFYRKNAKMRHYYIYRFRYYLYRIYHHIIVIYRKIHCFGHFSLTAR